MEYYDYPESRTDIFTPCDRNYFFHSRVKFSYLCSFEEMLDVDKSCMFTNSYVLLVYKRYAVIQDGIVVYENKGFNDGYPPCGRHGENAFVIITEKPRTYRIQSWKNDLITYDIRDDSENDKALNSKVYRSAESAVSDAVKISEASGEKCAVVQWFDEYDRHMGVYSGLYDKYGNLGGRIFKK